MTILDAQASPDGSTDLGPADEDAAVVRRRHRWYSVSNIGVVYVWLLIIVVFALITPDLFLSSKTVSTVLNQHAITGLVALSLILPMAAGVFDLSVGATVGLSAIVVARLLTSLDMAPWLAIVLTLLVCLLVGVVNGLIVVKLNIHSFIATLASSSIIVAAITMISNSRTVGGPQLLGPFASIARSRLVGVTVPVFVMLAVATVLYYVLEHTALGRYFYATGFGRDAARLNGVQVDRIRFASLMASAFIAGIAGILLTARLSAGSPTVGPPFLLPAFAGAFVGATQLKAGRFNAWGTVIAVLMLGTGVEGLSLSSAPVWASDVFVGAALVLALWLTGVVKRTTHLAGS